MEPLGRVRLGLPRRASLKHRKWIRALFDPSEQGTASVAAGCIRLVFRIVIDVTPSDRGRVFVGFSPGSRIRGAVNRNRVKRQLRECYRHEQHTLSQVVRSLAGALTLMIVYRGAKSPDITVVRTDMQRVLSALSDELHTRLS